MSMRIDRADLVEACARFAYEYPAGDRVLAWAKAHPAIRHRFREAAHAWLLTTDLTTSD